MPCTGGSSWQRVNRHKHGDAIVIYLKLFHGIWQQMRIVAGQVVQERRIHLHYRGPEAALLAVQQGGSDDLRLGHSPEGALTAAVGVQRRTTVQQSRNLHHTLTAIN
jgi:hypothetical protein